MMTGAPDGSGDLSSDPDPQTIYGGGPSQACTWPTAVSLGGCTGTLVHPRVVIYAGHCGSTSSVKFADDHNGPGRTVATEFCRTYNYQLGSGNDWAFCVLTEEVTDVPITPPLMGCETELLTPGREVYIVGFGQNDDGGSGRKYEAQTSIISVGIEANIGDSSTGICYGDSGGPTFIRLPEEEGYDGSWRAFGIASYINPPCGSTGWHSLMHSGMQWFESESGIDITPCHDADGTWNPGPDCKGFTTDPLKSEGAWDTCSFGEVSDWSATCGQTYPELTDAMPPQVDITSHDDGDLVVADDTGMANVSVIVHASDTDSGVREVALLVDGVAMGEALLEAPYEFTVPLATGEHELSAVAIDEADNEATATPIRLEVAEHGAPPGDDDDDDAGDDAGDAGDDDDDAGDDDDDDEGDDDDDGVKPWDEGEALPGAYGSYADEGCGCRSTPRSAPSGLAILFLLGLRRRGDR